MSSSQSSFVNNHLALEESLALLEQKSLIVEKYVEKVSVLQNKIEELVLQIQRLNWEKRQKEYQDEYIRKISVKKLMKEGFGQEIMFQGSHQQNDKSSNNDKIQNKIVDQSQQENKQEKIESHRKILIKIIVDPQTQQILLTQNMQLIKDSLPSIIDEQKNWGQNYSQAINSYHPSQMQIESYCQSVMKQVQQMRYRLQNQDQSNKEKLVKLEQENKILTAGRKQLEQLLQEGRIIYERQRLFKDKQFQNIKSLNQLKERDYNQLTKETEQLKLKYQEEINQKQQLINQLNQTITTNQQASKNTLQKLQQSNSNLVSQLQTQIIQLKSQKSQQQAQIQLQKNKTSQLQTQISQLQSLNAQQQTKIDQLQYKIEQLEIQITDFNKKHSENHLRWDEIKNNKDKQINQLIENHSQHSVQTQSQIKTLKDQLTQLNQTITQLTQQLNQQKSQKNQLQTEIYQPQVIIPAQTPVSIPQKQLFINTQQKTQNLNDSEHLNQIIQLNLNIQNLKTKLQNQSSDYETKINSLNQQNHSLNQQNLSLHQQITSLNQQIEKITLISTQSSKQLTVKRTLVQQLQLKLQQLSQQLFSQQQIAAHLRNILSSNEPTIKIIHNSESTFSQTDPELVLDVHFLRQTKQKINPESIQQHQICLPPSLDMLAFDFDNSMSSSAQNMSNLSINYGQKQLYSNLSSSSFSKNDKQMDQMHTTNIVKVHEQKKSSSQQKIQLPLVTDHQEKPHSNQNIRTDYQNAKTQESTALSQLKQLKPRAKVASYSEKNIIVQQPNEDEDQNEFKKKSKKNILLNVNPYIIKPTKSEGSQDLIQSRSAISSSDSDLGAQEVNGQLNDPINDQDFDLGDSDHPSQTYKNSLILPKKKSSSANSQHMYQANYDSSQISKTLPVKDIRTDSPGQPQHKFRASQLLQLKSPENIMKSLIQKSFPIQKNPFKLSNEYINVGEIIKQQSKNAKQRPFDQKAQSSNFGSGSLVNIMIESQQGCDINKSDEVKNSIPEKNNISSSTPGTPQGSSFINKFRQQNTGRYQNEGREVDFMTPKKKEQIQLAESLDFASLKLIEKENNQNSKSKKKPKIIFLRR